MFVNRWITEVKLENGHCRQISIFHGKSEAQCHTAGDINLSGERRETSLALKQASPLDIRKKTQGRKNSKLKQKTQTQAKNSNFRYFSEKRIFSIAKKLAFSYKHTN